MAGKGGSMHLTSCSRHTKTTGSSKIAADSRAVDAPCCRSVAESNGHVIGSRDGSTIGAFHGLPGRDECQWSRVRELTS